MILTKAKESQLTSLTSGVTSEIMQLSVSQSGNFWVDWADAFIKLCINKLGLEVEEGPGTSIGRVQQAYGPTRYQYDCDWNEENGRVAGYDFEEKGFTLWEDVPIWENSLKEYGLDRVNRRFDFILWFTTSNPDTSERMGIRFKYPITTERGFNCSWFISRTPAIMPWCKENDSFNNERLGYKFGVYNGRIDVETIYNPVATTVSVADIYDRVSYLNNANHHNGCLTSVFTIGESLPWTHYSDDARDEGALYSTLGGNYSSAPPMSYKDYNIFQYTVSDTKNTIDLKIKNSNGDLLFDILFGNLMEEQVNENNITNSFISLIVTKNSNYFSDWLFTEKDFILRPSKMINRPTTISVSQRSYWGISRVLLEKQYIHCKDLYQVFSFSELMDTNEYALKVFVDKNNDEHNFILFNYGYVDNAEDRLSDVLLAIPI